MVPQWWSNLIAAGLIDTDQLADAETVAAQLGIKTEHALVYLGFLSEDQIHRAKAEALGVTWIELENLTIPAEVLELVPSSVALENCCLPIGVEGDQLLIAMIDPEDSDLLEKLEFILDWKIVPVMATPAEIRRRTARHDQHSNDSVECILVTPAPFDSDTIDIKDDRSPIAKLLQLILSESVRMGAVSIHIEPFADRFRVQYQIDGQLMERDSPPIRIYPKLSERIMYLAKRESGTSADFMEGNLVTEIEGTPREWELQTPLTEFGHSFVLSLRQ